MQNQFAIFHGNQHYDQNVQDLNKNNQQSTVLNQTTINRLFCISPNSSQPRQPALPDQDQYRHQQTNRDSQSNQQDYVDINLSDFLYEDQNFEENKLDRQYQEVKYLVCVDPQSSITYLLNLRSQNQVGNQIIIQSQTIFQDIENTDFQRHLVKYKEKIDKDKAVMNELLKIPNFEWDYGSNTEADKYRRRKFQRYLISKEASQYPSYAYQSQLSKAFDQHPSIKIIVYLNEYSDDLLDTTPLQQNQSLVTSAQEVLKSTKRRIQSREKNLSKNKKFSLNPRGEGNEFVLKAFGYRQYLIGGYPLLSYDRVRKALRKQDALKLTLTQKPTNQKKESFPIILKHHPKIRHLKNVSPFFWYPPDISLKYQLEKMRKQQFNPNITPDEKYKIQTQPVKQTMILYQYQQQLNKSPIEQAIEDVDVIIFSAQVNWKFRIKIGGLEHLNLLFRQLESENKPGNYRVATNNGQNFPRNLTNIYDKKQFKQAKKQNKLKKKTDKKHPKEQSSNQISNLVTKSTKISVANQRVPGMKQDLKFPYDYPFVNFSNNFHHLKPLERFKKVIQAHKKTLHTKFFIPYQLYVQVQLIHGCEVLATSKTKNIPFSYSPRFNQWLTFSLKENIPKSLWKEYQKEKEKVSIFSEQEEEKEYSYGSNKNNSHKYQSLSGGGGEKSQSDVKKQSQEIDWTIRYCQLPKKTRLAFNVKALSNKGQEETIASSTFLIFDCDGIFQEGKHALKLWPFYKVDQRLGCMKQYCGYQTYQDNQQPRNRIFPLLFLQCQRFAYKMHWFPRDQVLIDKCHLSTNLIDNADKKMIGNTTKNQTIADMKKLLDTDPISKLEIQDKIKIFECRQHYMKISNALPIFLRSVNWLHPLQVNQVLKLIKDWQKMSDQQAISLLDAKFADQYVRLYALE